MIAHPECLVSQAQQGLAARTRKATVWDTKSELVSSSEDWSGTQPPPFSKRGLRDSILGTSYLVTAGATSTLDSNTLIWSWGGRCPASTSSSKDSTWTIGGKEACFMNPDPVVTLMHSATLHYGGKGCVCLQNTRCLPSRRCGSWKWIPPLALARTALGKI